MDAARRRQAEAQFNAALDHYRRGDLAKAERLARSLLSEHADNPQLLMFIAAVCYAQRRLEEAANLLESAVQIAPQSAEAHYNLGTALKDLGRNEEAVRSLNTADRLRPNNHDTLNNLGLALIGARDLVRAETAFRRAIALKPQSPLGHHNLGTVLQLQGRPDDARRSLARALELKHPEPAVVMTTLAGVLNSTGRRREAVELMEHALRIDARLADTHLQLAIPLMELGEHDRAIVSFEQALRLASDKAPVASRLVHLKRELCSWADIPALDDLFSQAIQSGSATIDPFVYLNVSETPGEQGKVAAHYSARIGAGLSAMPTIVRAANGRVRLGYLSADFHDHATSRLMTALLERHDRSRFEVVGFSFDRDDGSDTRQRVVAAFDAFVDLREATVAQTAERVHRDRIDIAIDLKGYTSNHRAAALAPRPAPIQVNYLGHPGTLGAPWIDYIVADRFLIPPGSEAHFSEQVVYLPDTYQPTDNARPAVTDVPSRSSLGLPDDAFVFCSMNAPHKITPEMFDVWMRVLTAVPGSVLWVYTNRDPIEANLKREAQARGVDPGRLIMAPRLPNAEHIARQAAADLMLDTLPYNAHTTASDALWAGLPLLTCAGQSFAARVGGSILRAIGLPELITTSLADYEATAIALATDRDRLAGIRAKLAANRLTTPLFDTARYTRHLEAAYTAMWERHLAGLPPAPIDVAALDKP